MDDFPLAVYQSPCFIYLLITKTDGKKHNLMKNQLDKIMFTCYCSVSRMLRFGNTHKEMPHTDFILCTTKIKRTVAVFFLFPPLLSRLAFSLPPLFHYPRLRQSTALSISSLLLLNSATLSPNSIGKDTLPNNLGLCKCHLSFPCLLSAQINITATTLNVTGLVFKD